MSHEACVMVMPLSLRTRLAVPRLEKVIKRRSDRYGLSAVALIVRSGRGVWVDFCGDNEWRICHSCAKPNLGGLGYAHHALLDHSVAADRPVSLLREAQGESTRRQTRWVHNGVKHTASTSETRLV